MTSLGNGAYSMMSNRVTIKRSGPITQGKRGDLVTLYSDVPCTNLLPISSDIMVRMPDKVPNELLQAFVPGSYEVLEGDWIVLGDSSYPVRASDRWELRGRSLLLIVLDKAMVTSG